MSISPKRPTDAFRAALLPLFLVVSFMPSDGALAQGGSPCAPVANGGEILLSDAGNGTHPSLAMFADGSGILVWESGQSPGNDASGVAVLGRFFDSNGLPVGERFQINTWTDQRQLRPDVAAAPDGRFVVVWHSDSSPHDASGSSIRGRRFGSNGQPIGGDFAINDHTPGDQEEARVAMADDGSFVVTWESDTSAGSDSSSQSVQARRFGANGSALGAQFQVNTRTSSFQQQPDIAAAPGGGFVIVFTSRDSAGTDQSGDSIQMRRYSASGVAQGPESQVNVTTTFGQARPAVAVDADGTYLVAWESDSSAGTDNTEDSIQARGFLPSGIAAGNEQQVNTRVFGDSQQPDVAALGEREFLVGWAGDVQGSTYADLRARAMTLETEMLGFPFTVTQSVQQVAVAGNRNGKSLTAARAIARPGEIVGGGYTHPCVGGPGITDCVEDLHTLCLNKDRFRVTSTWRASNGDTGQGRAVELTPDTGYFWFFDAANVEAVIKTLDACGLNQRFWVFLGGLTDIEVRVVVEDTDTSEVRVYENPLGTPFELVNDTDAFATCP